MTHTFDHVAILASAGTGKTFQLTSRYIGLLTAGVPPEQILATTFTRKAAGEILSRVLTRLASASLNEGTAEKLSLEINLDPRDRLHAKDWQALLTIVARSLNRLSISTLDAFFARIASGFALELGGGGAGGTGGGGLGWEVADEETLADLRTQAISRVLASPDRAALIDLLRSRTSGLISRSIHGELHRATLDAYAAFIASDTPAWAALTSLPPLDAASFKKALDLAAHAPIPVTGKGEPKKHWSNGVRAALDSATKGDFDTFVSITLISRLYQGVPRYDRSDVTGDFRDHFAPLLAHASSVLLTTLHHRTIATCELLRRFDAELSYLKSSRGLLAFDDVPRLLLGTSLADRLHELYFRLDSRLSHVLLDEFQDTSILQWRLLEPLIDEVVSGEGTNEQTPKSLLCVGDVKQSLYAWRDAEPDLLPYVHERWPQVVQEELVTNRRSSPVIMDAVNTVFDSLAANSAFPTGDEPGAFADSVAASRWHGRFKNHVAHETFPGRAALLTPPIPDGADPKDRKHLLRFAAQRIAALHNAAPHASIGVLFRSKKDIPTLKHLLSDRHNLSASEEGGNPLADSPPVAVALSLLTLADEPGNTAAAFHVAHSPLGRALSLPPGAFPYDVRRVTAAIRSDLTSLGYARTLQRWLLSAVHECTPHDAQRFEQLITLAQEYDTATTTSPAGTLRPGDFVRLVQSRRVDDPTAAPIRLMSIHAAKGLEFDCVVLPDLDATLCRNPPGVLTHRPGVTGLIDTVTLAPKKDAVWIDPRLHDLYVNRRLRTIRDEICALYVAMTRAVHSLDMIVKPSSNDALPLSLAGILRGALAHGTAPADEMLWHVGDDQWHTRATDRCSERSVYSVTESSTPPLSIPALTLDWSSRTRFAPGITPASRVSGARSTLPRTLTDIGDSARERGILIHAWLALINWIDEDEPTDDALLATATNLGLTTVGRTSGPSLDVQSHLATFRAALARNDIRAALSKSSYQTDSPFLPLVWREQPFAVPTATGGILSGRFDRLVILTTQHFPNPSSPLSLAALDPSLITRAEIIDFKTDTLSTKKPGAVEARTTHYRPQLQAYEEAAATLLGLHPTKVHSKLLFLAL